MGENVVESWVLEASSLPQLLGRHDAAWASLVGETIVHNSPSLGHGRITSVLARLNYHYQLKIEFASQNATFNSDGLRFFSLLHIHEPEIAHELLHPHLLSMDDYRCLLEDRENARKQKERQEALLRRKAEEERQAQERRLEEEKVATREYEELRERYGARPDTEPHPSHPLFAILKRIESGESLLEKDMEFLKQDRQYRIQAEQFEHAFDFGDHWAASKASSAWRKYGDSFRAVKFSDRALKVDMSPRPKVCRPETWVTLVRRHG